MFMTNIEVENGIVNGAIGVLKNVKLLREDEHYGKLEAQYEPSTSVATHRQRFRLWIEFPLEIIELSYAYHSRYRTKGEMSWSEDISTDSIINQSNYLAIKETWMEDSMPVNAPDFDL
ncbi:hypothetical protein TNCV_3011331 [Trichonephila clavipes]|nr:hypothetical protein TNCV_3011331 [Trichonephila clavipes]